MNTTNLSLGERTVFALRDLYKSYGYTRFKMSKFEEYDLYAGNKNFLVSDNVITFTDTDGKLMALKPDVTLSIVRAAHPLPGRVEKVFYDENVYRVSKGTHTFKEILQAGLECIGDIDAACLCQVLTLAARSLSMISPDYVLVISHAGIIAEVLDSMGVPELTRAELIKCIGEKNTHGAAELCRVAGIDPAPLLALMQLSGTPAEVLPALRAALPGVACDILCNTVDALCAEADAARIKIDFSVVNDMNYYNGIVFRGYVSGIPTGILSGGQYGSLVRRMGKDCEAIGFAVYLDLLEDLERISAEVTPEDIAKDDMLNVALPKGRLGERVYAMFAKAGFECPAVLENSRKLIFENPERKVRYFWVKPSDVAIYVERGAADIGVAGKDILLEYDPEIYELLDLRTGKCRMAVAAKNDFYDDPERTLRVATKFSNIARTYYRSVGRDIDIIHLNGSIEIAPILGLSDVIVDIVETGKTLAENDLGVRETIVNISARLIANKSAYRFKNEAIETLRRSLAEQVESDTERK